MLRYSITLILPSFAPELFALNIKIAKEKHADETRPELYFIACLCFRLEYIDKFIPSQKVRIK